jgi:hypothetical protein
MDGLDVGTGQWSPLAVEVTKDQVTVRLAGGTVAEIDKVMNRLADIGARDPRVVDYQGPVSAVEPTEKGETIYTVARPVVTIQGAL